MRKLLFAITAFSLVFTQAWAQGNVVDQIIKEANDNSMLEQLAYELLDKNGPRLVGTPQMQNAHEWAVNRYNGWGITAHS